MGLRKNHVKKRDPSLYNSRLFGIIAKAESTNQMRNSEPSFPVALNFKARTSVGDAMLEAEYRKAQAISRTRKIHYM